MINGISNRLSFGGLEIKFVSNDEFDQAVSDLPSDNSAVWITVPYNRTITGPKVGTDRAAGCFAGGPIDSSNNATLSHYLAANTRNFDQIKPQLGITPDKTGGLITGGKVSSSGDANALESMALVNQVKQEFINQKVPYSNISGQTHPNSRTNLCYRGDMGNNGTWLVNYRQDEYIEGDDEYDEDALYGTYAPEMQIQSPADINRAYFNVQIDPEDQVFIGDTPVDSSILNTVDPTRNPFQSDDF